MPPQLRSRWLFAVLALAGATCFQTASAVRRLVQLLFILCAVLVFPFLVSYYIHAAQPRAPTRPPKKLRFATPASFDSLSRKQAWEREAAPNRQSLHSSFSSGVDSSIDKLLSQIIQHFVLSWWSPLTSPLASPAFPNAVEELIRSTLPNVFQRAEHVDWPSLLVAQILPLFTTHITRFKEAGGLAAALQAEDTDLLLSQRFASLSEGERLHPAVDVASANTRPSEERFLRETIERILPLVLPPTEAKSQAVLAIVRELLASTILLPIIDMLCEPDLWNMLIDTKIQAAISEREQVAALRAALDSAPQGPPSPSKSRKRSENQQALEISATTSTKDFESFLRSIKRCSSLIEARRLRNDILLSIRKTQKSSGASLASHYERLELALQRVDARIAALGGTDGTSVAVPSGQQAVSLSDILRHSTALSFWMEYMERRHRLILVQFWLTVEGLRDPLDDNTDQSAPEILKSAQDDAALLYGTFFAQPNPVTACCSERHVNVLRQFPNQVQGSLDVQRVRSAIHALQQEVFEEMESEDYPHYQDSDLSVKMSTELAQSSTSESPAKITAQPSKETPHTSSLAPLSLFAATAQAASSIPMILQPAKLMTLRRADTAPPRVVPAKATVEAPIHSHSDDSLTAPGPSSPSSSTAKGSSSLGTDASTFAFVMGLGDEEAERAPLFDEAPLTPSSETKEIALEDEDDRMYVQRMRAIEEALSSIVEGADKASRPQPGGPRSQATAQLQRAASAAHISSKNLDVQATEKRNVSMPIQSSVPQSSTLSQRPSLFDDDSEPLSNSRSSITFPEAPNSNSIELEELTAEQLSTRIEHLLNDERILRGLIQRAELTGNHRELTILSRSLDSVTLEKQTLEFRLRQNGGLLLSPGRTSVSISSTTQGGAEGKEFILYLVSVEQQDPEGEENLPSGWFVARRYSEFFDLHTALRAKYPVTRQLDFPSKRLVTFMSPALVEQRRLSLERYLQNLLTVPEICRSGELQAFLSRENVNFPSLAGSKLLPTIVPAQSFLRNVYRSVAVGLDELTAGPSLFDTMAQRLAQHASDLSNYGLSPSQQEDLMQGYPATSTIGTQPESALPEGLTHFTAPICDLFIEIFELKDRSQWLRRQAILIVLQQILGGTIERRFRESLIQARTEDNLQSLISTASNTLFPDGCPRPSSRPRNEAEKDLTRHSAKRRLSTFLPEAAASVTGRQSAQRAAQTLFAVLQNKRLLKHLVYSVLEMVMAAMFPEAFTRQPIKV